MEVRPGYKQTEVGVIPEDWEVAAARRSVATREVVIRLTRHVRVFDGARRIPWYSQLENIGCSLDRASTYCDTSAEDGARANSEFVRRRCLISRTAARLSDCRDRARRRMCAIMSTNRVRHSSHDMRCRARFFDHALRRQARQATLSRAESRSAHDQADRLQSFKQLHVPLPPTKAEQEAIAEALSDADALIESLEQLLAKKRQLKQGAMQELLTGKKRLPGFSGEWEVSAAILRRFRGGRASQRNSGHVR